MSNKRLSRIESSQSVAFAAQIEQRRREGHHVLSLAIGEIPEAPPDFIVEATERALREGKTQYSSVQGELKLRELISIKLQTENAVKVSPEQIIIGNGSKQILYSLMQIICNEGDEVIVPAPYWVTFTEIIKLAGGNPVLISSNELSLDIEKIKQAITPRTKAVIINSPNNPSGKVYAKSDVEKLVELTQQRGIYLISDEAYEQFVYEGEHISPASIDPTLENILTVQSFSKSFC